MNDHLHTYSVLTADLFVQNWHAGGFFTTKYTEATLHIRPVQKSLGATVDKSGKVRAELKPDTPLDGRPFLPTPLSEIDPAAQHYFRKYKLLRNDGMSVHPWQIYLWSRKQVKSGDAIKVLASENGVGSWIVFPMTKSELAFLSAASKKQRDTMAAERAARDAKLDVRTAELALKGVQQESRALEKALAMTASKSGAPKPSSAVPKGVNARHQRPPPGSQRSSFSQADKKSAGYGSSASSIISKF